MRRASGFMVWLLGGILLLTVGCASPCRPTASTTSRRFDFAQDTFSYSNGLVWEYRYDDNGKWTTRRREPPPDYSQHCFVVSRSACQFFENAAFEPQLPKSSETGYRALIRQVVATSLRNPLPATERIVVPGYANLRSFSKDYEGLLKAECGGAWRCYFQKGNWRMIFPFSRKQQVRVEERLEAELRCRGAVVVHVVRFPQLSINHAMLVYGTKASNDRVTFDTYDPNEPGQPTTITFDRASRTFFLPANAYFRGGRVDLYPIYDRLLY